jgi:hypothetical protein
VTVVGSFYELEQRSSSRVDEPHRTRLDDIALTCACGLPAVRVHDIVAPWFQAGRCRSRGATIEIAGERLDAYDAPGAARHRGVRGGPRRVVRDLRRRSPARRRRRRPRHAASAS